MLRRPLSLVAAVVAAATLAAHGAAAPRGPATAPPRPDPSFNKPAFELLSRTLLEGPASTVSFAGSDILLGTGNGVAIFRGGALASPAFVPLQGEPRQILVNGSLAYVAAFSGGIEVLEISGPGSPREIYRRAGIEAVSCAIAGGALFAVDAQGRLFAFNLSNPREPVLGETKAFDAPALSLSAEGDLLAVVSQKKVSIFRASAGGALRMLSEARADSDIKRGILRGGVLLVLTTKGEVLAWHLANPARPASLKRVPMQGIADITAAGDRGMLLTNSELVIPFRVERANGTPVRIKTEKGASLGSVNRYGQPIATGSPSAPPAQKASAIFISERELAVIYPFEGLRLYDLSGRSMNLTGAFATPGFAINLLASKGLLYVANGYDGVRIGRVGSGGTVDWIGHLQTDEARDVALLGKYLVIADGTGGLKVADASDPARPRIVGKHSSPYFISALAVSGDRAYLAGGIGGVEVVDLSAPQRPSLVWRRDFSEVRGICADGKHLYFADGNDGFRVYALGKGDPVELSVLNTPGWNCDVFVSGNTAYLADGGNGVIIVDISDRKKPRTLASLSLGTLTRVVFLRGTTLFAAAHTKGVAAIDVSDPRKPVVAAWYDTADDGRGVFADTDYVYAASGSGGVYIFRYAH